MNNPFAASGETIKFPQEQPGKRVDFKIREYRTEMGTEYQSSAPKEEHVLLVTTTDGEDGKIYLSTSALRAMGDAMRAAGNNGLPEEGAIASLTYTGMQKAASGFNFKHFEATYQRPVSAAGAFASAAPQAQAPAPQAQAPAPQGQAVDPSQFFSQQS